LPPLITSGEVSRAEFYRERRDRNPDREPSISSGDVSPWEPTDELNGSNVPAEPPPSPRSISLYSPGDSSRYWSLFLGIQVCMTFPLKASDRLLGVLCLYWNEDRKPRADCTADEETTCDCVDCALLEEAAKLASEDVAKGHQPGGNTVSVADGAGLAAGPASAEEALTRLNFLPELEAIELGNAPPDLSPLSLTTLRNAETVKRWLVDVGRALEVGRASLFVRDRTNGHYVPLLEPDENAADCHYAPGEGGTGLVIKQRRALLINDCGDPRELAQLGIREFKYDLRIWDRDKDKLAFLAVPIFVGEDVLGVLRFLRLTPRNAPAPNDGPPFTEIHQKLAEAAAERLARWLYKLQEHRDAHIRKTLPSSIFQSLDRIEVCENLHQALEWRIGPCRCLVRLRDKRERGDGNLEEVLDRWFVSDHSDSLWPQYRTRDDPDSGLVWREGRTQVIADVPAERQRRIDNGQQPDQWMNEAGCAVIVSMSLTKASPFRSVTYSTNFYREMVGILAVIRDNPHSFLPSDIKFVEQMAELAGPAFVKLAQTEEDHIQDSLNCALINYFFNRLKKMPPHAASAQLLLEINTALTLGVGGAVGYVWRVEDTSGKLLRGLEPADAPAPQDVPWAALQQELGDRHFLVVSDIDGDKRLKCLLDALPNKQGARYQNCQRACILLDRTEHLRILHPALFFLVVLPPQRLSYERVEHLFRNLITTVIYRD
jgi:GAF domain-containing protein